MAPEGPKDPIIAEAAEVKRRLEEKAEQEALRKEEAKRKARLPPRTFQHGDRLMTWWRVQVPLANMMHLFAWAFAIFACAMVVYVFFLRKLLAGIIGSPKLFPVLCLIVGCLAFTALLAGAVSAFRFVSWRNRLAFGLTGWQNLVDYPDFGSEELWRHCTIEIGLFEESPEAAEAYHAALVIFSEEANTCYFAAEGGSQRKEWTAVGLTASGSANRHVARKIKQMCEGNLSRLERKYGFLKEVRITPDKTHFWASRPSGD